MNPQRVFIFLVRGPFTNRHGCEIVAVKAKTGRGARGAVRLSLVGRGLDETKFRLFARGVPPTAGIVRRLWAFE